LREDSRTEVSNQIRLRPDFRQRPGLVHLHRQSKRLILILI
jgi:hypothetical protein